MDKEDVAIGLMLFLMFFLGMISGFCSGFRGGAGKGAHEVQIEAIEQGYAEWIIDKEGNTKFQWKEKE